jgi:hypothetical protein
VKLFLVLSGAIGAMLLAGCSSDSEGGGELTVTLNEWSITLDKASLPEGPIEFIIKNEGEREHEFIIVRTDIGPEDLPKNNDGSADLDAPDVEEIHTVDEIEDGDETGRTYTLDAGKYVFIDNTVEERDGVILPYYEMGMHVAFTLTEEGESPSAAASGTPTAQASATPTPTS